MSEHGIKKVTLEYFGIRGRGEAIRLLLHDAGIPFDDVEVGDNWREQLKPNRSRYLFGQVPIIDIDGLVLAQQDAILRYICRRIGYTSTDTEEEAYADMLGCLMEDMGPVYTRACYAQLPAEEKKTQLIEVATVKLPTFLGYIEGVYGKRTFGEFLVYKDKPCFAEFVLLNHLLAFTILRPTILDDFPLLSKWLAMMKGRPGIKAYIESGKLRKQINGNPAGDEPVC